MAAPTGPDVRRSNSPLSPCQTYRKCYTGTSRYSKKISVTRSWFDIMSDRGYHSIWSVSMLSLHLSEKRTSYYLSIESHFVGVHGPYGLHRKEKQIFMHRVRLIFTSFYNKVCRGIAYYNTKMSYLSDFKRTKSKTLTTAITGRMTNWTNPPCDPVQIIRTKDWYF